MKHFILISLLLALVHFSVYGQKLKPNQAWKVTFKTSRVALPNATAEEKEKVADFNAQSDSVHLQNIFSDSLFKLLVDYNHGHAYHLTVNRRDSITFNIFEGDNYVAVTPYSDYLSQQKNDTLYQLIHFEHFPDSTAVIAGFSVEKVTYDMVLKGGSKDTIQVESWVTTALPDWFWSKGRLDGVSLKTISVENHVGIVKSVDSVERITLTNADYFPPEGYETYDKETHPNYWEDETESLFDQAARDSLLAVLKNIQADSVIQSAAIFRDGFAQVTENDRSFYIDENGDYAFDNYVDNFHPSDSISALHPGWVSINRNKKITHYIVKKNGKYGLVGDDGEWLLNPEYDNIKLVRKRRLAIYSNGKMGYADTWGNVSLPPKFDEANIMGDYYYDVRKGDKWGIFSREKQKMITPFSYDEFDFCGGCGGRVSYAYASKNGKWGVLSFDGEVLVPFEYEHPAHYGMRSDNWVTSYEKDSVDVVINMNTNTVYSANEYGWMRVMNGALALEKDGKFGFVGKDGQQLTSFRYDDVSDPYGNFSWGPYIGVSIDSMMGIIRNDGKVMVPADNYDMVWVSNDYFEVKKAGKVGMINAKGEMVLPLIYDDVNGSRSLEIELKSGQQVQLYELTKDEKVGFYNPENGVILKPQYDRLDIVLSADSLTYYIEADEKWGEDYYDVYKGLYAANGTLLMPTNYDDYRLLNQRWVKTEESDDFLYGLYDLQNQKEVLKPIYTTLKFVNDRYVYTVKGDLYSDDHTTAIFDTKKGEWLDLGYSDIRMVRHKNLIIVSDTTNSYLWSLTQQKRLSKPYPITKSSYGDIHNIESFSHGLAEVSRDGKEGFINTEGKEVVPAIYDEVKITDGGVIRLTQRVNDNFVEDRFVDSLGQPISDKVFKRPRYGYGGYADIQVGDYLLITDLAERGGTLYGVMNLDGEILVPAEYDKIFYFPNGEGFIVQRDRHFGLFNENGGTIVPVVLDNVYFRNAGSTYTDFVEASGEFPILCQIDGVYFYVNQDGSIWPFVAEERDGDW